MINNKSIQQEIAVVLRKIGSNKCLAKAKMLEDSTSIRSLKLRDLDLTASNVIAIVNCLNPNGAHNDQRIQSISFSYNHLLGDSGAIALIKNLPRSIREIGLVNCGISDIGGMEILHWMSNSPMLQMICMEQNNFSSEFRAELRNFKSANPKVLVIY